MKTKFVVLLALAFAAWPVRAAEHVDLGQLPPAVKKSLDHEAGGDFVRQITVRHEGGHTIYDIELERKNLPNPHLAIAENGTVLREPHFGSGAIGTAEGPLTYSSDEVSPPVARRFRLEALSPTVQRTIERAAGGRAIAAITEDQVDGQNAYAVEFKESGRNPRIYVSTEGELLRPMEKPRTLTVGPSFSDLPTATQSALRREIGDREIVKIDREGPRDSPTYRVDVKGRDGTFQLRLSEDGRVLEDTRGRGGESKRG